MATIWLKTLGAYIEKAMLMPAEVLNERQRCLLDMLQNGIPLNQRPFITIGEKLGIKESDVLESISVMKKSGLIRRLGGIFDSNSLGYVSTLAAARVLPKLLDDVAAIISKEPGVTHNYRREHEFNLWFTFTSLKKEIITAKLSQWESLPGVERILYLPAVKLFKIGVKFNFSGNQSQLETVQTTGNRQLPLTEKEKAAVRALYQLPLTPETYRDAGIREGLSEEELLTSAVSFHQSGVLRRVAAIVRHRQAGFTANAMTAWIVPDLETDEFGKLAAQNPSVSHIYLRPVYAEWPYNLYTMIHAATKEECFRTAENISLQTGIKDYQLLFSTKEYKKTSLRYFV